MAILPRDIQILFTNYDIIAYFLNLASCSEHFISIKHRIHDLIISRLLFWSLPNTDNCYEQVVSEKKRFGTFFPWGSMLN
jgi:hypothetical protein